ncbi:M14 family zinc carboxypeptidase [Paucimonas lemoignei]|nr:M14 family zinc carboxypeptidase [Paucimonas lemoignei]
MADAFLHLMQRGILASVCAAGLVLATTASAASKDASPASAESNNKAVKLGGATMSAARNAAPQVDWCQRFSARLASLSLETCRQSGLTPSGTLSVQGFPILHRQIPPVKSGKSTPPVRVLLLGGIHGDELTAPAIVFKWMQWMNQGAAQEFHWSVAPVVNPDGFLTNKPTRMNANGVDLNRNFPTPDWHQEAPTYWVKRTGRDPRRFPGKQPLSEPESRWVNDEIARFKPDVVISVHAPFGVLDFDGPVQPPRKFGRLVFTPVGVYPGSLGNYSGLHKKVPIITIELPNALAMPSEAESKKIWEDMLTWIQRNVSQKPVASPIRQVVAK